MNPYPTNWAHLVKIIGQHKPFELNFIETESGLVCQLGAIGSGLPQEILLSRDGFTGPMLRFEVTALLESFGFKPVDSEAGMLALRLEKTTMAAEPISPVVVLQHLLTRHQPKRIFLIWYPGGARLELVSTLMTPLYRHALGSREAAMKVDSYLRSNGWRVVEDEADVRAKAEGDIQYER